MAYKNNVLLGLMKKRTDFKGKNQVIALRYATQMGRSSVFATAKANATANAYGSFTITRAKDYAVGGIDTETIRAATDSSALVDELEQEIDGMNYAISRSLATAMYGNGGGAIGQVLGVGAGTFANNAMPGTNVTIGATQFIFLDPNRVTGIEVGMVLEAATTDGTSGSRRAGQMTVTAVDRDNGVVTCAGGFVGSFAANDYVFVQDDFGVKIKGLDAWIPPTAPTAGDNFFGQDRSTDVSRMAGIRWNGQGGPIEETINNSMGRVYREGGRPETCLMHPQDVTDLTNGLGSRTVYTNTNTDVAHIGYSAVKFSTQAGDLKVYSDPNATKGVFHLLQLDTWLLWSLGDCPGFLNEDEIGKIMRDYNTDSYQFRMGYFGNMVCFAPGYNARVVR